MRVIVLYVFIVLGCLYTSSFFAQKNEQKIDLVTFLKHIENQYNVTFSYADEKLKNIILPTPKNIASLEASLTYLETKTPFLFITQADKSVLVIPKNNLHTLCILVYDLITNELVKNASVKYNYTIHMPNEEGQFYMTSEKEKIDIQVNADGYLSKTFTVNIKQDKPCIALYLNPNYELLEEVFLTNLLTKGIQKIASGGLEINYKEFGLLPGLVEPDVLQSLQALPGITSRGESVSYLNVRGGTHDQNLFLWDGIKMYNTSHFFGMISAFNPYMTQKVSLIKNGTSAKYGDGVSSLIDMKTSNTIANKVKAEVGVNLINVDAIVEVPITKKSSFEFSSRQSVNSLWESPTYNSYFDKVFQNTEVTNFPSPSEQQNDEFNFFDTSLSYKNRISKNDYIKTNLFYSEDEFALNRFELENNQVNTRSSNLEQTNFAGGIFYERHWNYSTTSQFQFHSSQYNQNAQNINLINQQSLKQINEVREIGFRLNLQTQFNSTLGLEVGYQLNETAVVNSETVNDPEFFSEIRNSIMVQSIYSQINYKSTNQLLNINLGGRLNRFSKFDKIRFEPRFNLSYQFIPDLFLEVLAEQKSQVSSQRIDLQTDFLGVENRRWVLSNPENRPIIESQQVSAGLNFIQSSWFINADFYYKKVDGITTRSQGFQNQFEFAETHGSYDVLGMDFLINKNFDPISGWVSYSWSDNNYQFDELTPSSFRNNLDLRHVITSGLSYEKNNFKISTGFNWHSGAVNTLPSENQPQLPQEIQFEEPNSRRLDDYFRLDISSTFTFQLGEKIKAITGISFLNVLNSNNIYNEFYSIGANESIHIFQQNGLSFTPNFMFRLRF